MEFSIEIKEALNSGIEAFKNFIDNKLLTHSDYLESPHWIEDGSQVTVLNYLIQQYQEKEENDVENNAEDLIGFIKFVLDKTHNKNFGEPVHQAVILGKIKLAFYLLDLKVFDVNKRDEEGRTLLSLIISIKNRQLLKQILANKPELNATTRVTEARIQFQPLHEAIVHNFAYGVRELGRAGSDLSNPLGVMKDTPLILAARLGKIKALGALLSFPIEKLNIEAESNRRSENNETCDNAMESLCNLLLRDKNNKALIRGVAMLLCCGAEPPRNENLCQILANNRSDLLKEIDQFMDNRPELVDSFVNRCHLVGSPLHNIMYVDHSWGSTLRHLFGRPSDVAFTIEKLVTRKYSRRSVDTDSDLVLPTVVSATLKKDEPSFKLYAEFVRRYSEAYQNQKITNPWSTMRWMIAEGKCSWETVQEYARTHPGTRTQIIFDDMFKNLPEIKVHETIESTSGQIHYASQ